jgi:CheY-like chemotaxis protein/two-component sensor histidine kinase
MPGVLVDITARKQLEDALRDADRRKDEFLATLAHELRNPLAPIRNSLQILRMPRVDSGTLQQTRAMMERQVDHLVRLVDDLLVVSRVMKGKIELRKEPVELANVIARAVETVQPLIAVQGHRLDLSLPQESLLLDADPVRLAQVVGNLLTNAAKYTDAHGHIWLTTSREGNDVVLRIRDSGIGIAPDLLPHVFELFVQADHTSTKAQGGLGIGLTLARNLVQLHGGTIEAHSAGLGKGSEFVVRLPLLVQQHEGPRELPALDGGHEPASSGRRVLVIDDNEDAAVSLAMLLRMQGHDVEVAHDGLSALTLAKTFRPHVVFLDIGMPGMDGYEVARRLRREPGMEATVLAALTGWGQKDDRRRTSEAGFDHHLVKPLDVGTLEQVLNVS